jgi:hypothetical protein
MSQEYLVDTYQNTTGIRHASTHTNQVTTIAFDALDTVNIVLYFKGEIILTYRSTVMAKIIIEELRAIPFPSAKRNIHSTNIL